MDIVKKMWAAYCKAADGVTYDGKPLPTWEELGEGRQKCWVAAGKEAADEIERLQKRVELLEGYLNGALDFVEGFAHCYTEEARKALGEKE